MSSQFGHVTEMPGVEVSEEQILRLCHRYLWAGEYCRGRDVVEAGCGPGQGLGHLASLARSLNAGDLDETIVAAAQSHYGTRLTIQRFDAQALPFDDCSKDVVILFEALYYLPHPDRFVEEARRILRRGGHVLVATANQDLYDFSASPLSTTYFGVRELTTLFAKYGFSIACYGFLRVEAVPLRQRVFRPVKAITSKLGLMPSTMTGKRLLKRIVFGQLRPMPAEIDGTTIIYEPPTASPGDRADTEHKVIYCAARLNALD